MGKQKKKLSPYNKQSIKGKFTTSEEKHSKQDKLEVKNANRSKKKAYRQKLKKELKDEIQNFKTGDSIESP